MPFTLDHRLEESSHFLEDWDLCRVALKNDTSFPWLYLVPKRENIREIYELSATDQNLLIQEISLASRALAKIYKADKINTAALGNMVPQLHVHVFSRFKDDLAWPNPVWAVQWKEIPYTDSQMKTEVQKLKTCFGEMRGKR
jgi:diadenosine tetraphosphate (Ap4A) HIT family hydrolase